MIRLWSSRTIKRYAASGPGEIDFSFNRFPLVRTSSSPGKARLSNGRRTSAGFYAVCKTRNRNCDRTSPASAASGSLDVKSMRPGILASTNHVCGSTPAARRAMQIPVWSTTESRAILQTVNTGQRSSMTLRSTSSRGIVSIRFFCTIR